MIQKRLLPINICFLRFQVYARAYVRIWDGRYAPGVCGVWVCVCVVYVRVVWYAYANSNLGLGWLGLPPLVDDLGGDGNPPLPLPLPLPAVDKASLLRPPTKLFSTDLCFAGCTFLPPF